MGGTRGIGPRLQLPGRASAVGVGRSSATVEFFYYSWRPPAANCSGNGVEVHGKARLPSADDFCVAASVGIDARPRAESRQATAFIEHTCRLSRGLPPHE